MRVMPMSIVRLGMAMIAMTISVVVVPMGLGGHGEPIEPNVHECELE